MRLLQMVLACLVSRTLLGKPDGAPTASCQYMLPGHITNSGLGRHPSPIQHQDVAESPYIINATWDKQGEYVHVLITGSTIQGFLIQARETAVGPAVGKFKNLSKESKYQICNFVNSTFDPEASVTHRNSSIKEDLSFRWEPPLHGKGKITFYATIAKSYDKFWLKLPSNPIDLSILNVTQTKIQTTRKPTSSVTNDRGSSYMVFLIVISTFRRMLST